MIILRETRYIHLSESIMYTEHKYSTYIPKRIWNLIKRRPASYVLPALGLRRRRQRDLLAAGSHTFGDEDNNVEDM